MNILIYSPGYDVAGVGIGLKQAFDKCAPGWTARAICHGVKGFAYPTDIVTSDATAIAAHIQRADVVHVMEKPDAIAGFDLRGKTIVVQHLGSRYRADPAGISARCRAMGAIEVTTLHDLLRPGVDWLPAAVDLDALAILRHKVASETAGIDRSRRRQNQRDTERVAAITRFISSPARVRIAHAPTNRVFKSTAFILQAVERIARRHPIDFDLIERVSNAECLRRKAKADIFVDELTLGYGLNALECWGMGMPVVSGIADPATRGLMLRDFGELPFAEATAETLETVIESLVTDRELRETWAARGRAHAERFHSQAAVMRLAIDIYTRALS